MNKNRNIKPISALLSIFKDTQYTYRYIFIVNYAQKLRSYCYSLSKSFSYWASHSWLLTAGVAVKDKFRSPKY